MASPIETKKPFIKLSSINATKPLSALVWDLYPKEVFNLTDLFVKVKNNNKKMDICFHYDKSMEKMVKMPEEANLLVLIPFLWFLRYVHTLVGKAQY